MNQLRYTKRQTCELQGRDISTCRAAWRHVVTAEDLDTQLGAFDVLYCPICQLGITSPHPTEDTLGQLYDTKDSGDFDRVQHSPIDWIKDVLGRRRLARLIPAPDHGRIRR